MAQNDALFDLIHALSKAEKRYFKVKAKQHSTANGNNYVKLFDYLEKQKSYNKEAVQKALRKESFIKNYSATKNYLFNFILEALADFHEKKEVDLQLRRELRYAEILMAKKQTKSCKKRLDKIIKKARETNNTLRLYEAYTLERRFLANANMGGIALSDRLEGQSRVLGAIDSLQQFERVKWIYYKYLWLFNNKGKVSSSEELEEYKALVQDPIFLAAAHSDNEKLRAYQLDTMLRYYYLIEPNPEKCYDLTKAAYARSKELYETGKNKNIVTLLIKAQRFLYRALVVGKYVEIPIVLKYINQLPLNNELEKTLFCEVYFAVKFYYRIKTGDLKRVNFDIIFFEDQLEQLKGKLNVPFELHLYGIVAHLYFIMQDYPTALSWLERFINHPKSNAHQKSWGPACMFRLILLYETENFDQLQKTLRNTRRKLTELNDYPQFYQIFWKFWGNIVKTDSLKEANQVYQNTHEVLKPLYDSHGEDAAFGIFDFVDWIHAKMLGITYLAHKRRPVES